MTTTTLENTIGDFDDNKKKIEKSPWHESVPDQPEKSVTDSWKEQLALISALADNEPAEENLEEEKEKIPPAPTTDGLIKKVKDMETDGSLKKALDYLLALRDEKTPEKPESPIDSQSIVQVARLLSIMDESVYMRDLEAERKVWAEMVKYKEEIKSSMEKNEELGSEARHAIKKVTTKMDEITNQINKVANAMGLIYEPLCNFSSYGKWRLNGPYCGAFYRKPQQGDNGLIVVAFKGSGRKEEYFTDFLIKKISAKKSPVRGECHAGFFKGIFRVLPSELSADERVGSTIPFDLLKKELWRLTKKHMINDPKRPVPVWVTGHSLGGAYATHCWQGLLATFRLNPYDQNRVIRDLFTFGSPRVGDKTYASYPNDIKTSQRSWRFVNGNDFVTTMPYFGYQHVDRQVVISPENIELRDNKLVPPEGFMKDTFVGHLLGFPQHGLDSYWESLTRGAKSLKEGSWPESQKDVTSPPGSNLVTWSLGAYHPPEFVPSESHADSKPSAESVLQGNDRRIAVDPYDFKENGKWRSVVKVQSMFRPRNRLDPVWTMGTGWLIREDLVVTAGHNVYSKTYGGQAERIKCWIGYRGRKYASDPGVQHQKALNIVTTNSWYSMSSERQRDVALIQVSAPFEGGVNPFIFMDTDTKLVDQYLTVVGYPGDKKTQDENGNEDPGAEMWFHSERITFDLERDEGMIMYDIDTFGGQSGAPILLRNDDGFRGIGTHCYGAGGSSYLNSGNAIGGTYGNDYRKFLECLSGSEPENPTPIGTFLPNKSRGSGSEPDDGESSPEGEESFWDVFKKVAKIGSVALPSAGAFLGPVGTLFGTVAGGVLGSLAESEVQSGSPQIPETDVQENCIQRAQLAEAVLQCVIRLGQSSQSQEVFASMEEVWDRSYSKQVPQLVDFIGPVLTEYGFLIAANNWEKEVQPNPEKRKLLEGEEGKFTVSPPEGFEKSEKARFVRALFDGETKLVDGEESFSQWFKPLIEKAILMAKPLATQAATSALKKILDIVTKGSTESLPFQGTPRKDKPTIWLENAIRRALMADCALQVIETMDEKKLKYLTLSPTDAGHEESIIDSIKTRVQKIGPFALDFAKSTIVKYLPVLLKQLEKKLKPTTESDVNLAYVNSADPRSLMPDAVPASLDPMTIPVSAANGTVARIYEDDSNPDAPPEEPRPPASPKK